MQTVILYSSLLLSHQNWTNPWLAMLWERTSRNGETTKFMNEENLHTQIENWEYLEVFVQASFKANNNGPTVTCSQHFTYSLSGFTVVKVVMIHTVSVLNFTLNSPLTSLFITLQFSFLSSMTFLMWMKWK